MTGCRQKEKRISLICMWNFLNVLHRLSLSFGLSYSTVSWKCDKNAGNIASFISNSVQSFKFEIEEETG